MPGWVIAVIVIGVFLLWVLCAKIQWEMCVARCDWAGCSGAECGHTAYAGFGIAFLPVMFPILLIVTGVESFMQWRKNALKKPRQTRHEKRMAKITERQREVEAKLKLAEKERKLEAYNIYPNGASLR